MYHYVRSRGKGRFPNLHVRSLGEFENQLRHLQANFEILAVKETQNRQDPMNRRTAILTFDDGLKDHYTNVCPRLQRAAIVGAFYVSVLPLISRTVLDVHKIQLLLGSQDFNDLYTRLRLECGVSRLREYEESTATAGDRQRYDIEQVVMFKRFLQRDLEQPLRSEILGRIFEHFFPEVESEISSQLYMSIAELRELRDAGMHIGNHTMSHYWLGHVDFAVALSEIMEAESILLEERLMDESFKTFAFPYGDVNDQVVELLEKAGYRLAFTTVPEAWNLAEHSALRVPRFDTNDFPF